MKYRILSNVFLKDRRFLLELAVPAIFKEALPGQFLHIRVEDSCDPLLRRPLSIHDCFAQGKNSALVVRVLYEAVGKGTSLLSDKKVSSEVDCLGPLGNGFDMQKIITAKKIYIAAGGMGVAPLYFLARKIAETCGSKSEAGKIVVLIGAKTKDDILREKEFKSLGCEVHIATEDGSRGSKGRVTDLLRNILAAGCKLQAKGNARSEAGANSQSPEAVICACGPKAMLAVVSDIARQSGVSAQVSLEEFMGCGLGACLGCVIRTSSGYKRICHDGPVFDASEVIWKE